MQTAARSAHLRHPQHADAVIVRGGYFRARIQRALHLHFHVGLGPSTAHIADENVACGLRMAIGHHCECVRTAGRQRGQCGLPVALRVRPRAERTIRKVYRQCLIGPRLAPHRRGLFALHDGVILNSAFSSPSSSAACAAEMPSQQSIGSQRALRLMQV